MSTTPFARLGQPLQKEAFVQKAIDGAWNGARDNFVNPALATAKSTVDGAWNGARDNFVNPAIGAAKSTVSGLGTAAAGVGNQIADTATAVPKAVIGGLSGLASGASQGLGGAAQGAVDGVWNSGKATGESMLQNGAQTAGGLGQAAKGVGALGGLAAMGPLPSVAAGAARGFAGAQPAAPAAPAPATPAAAPASLGQPPAKPAVAAPAPAIPKAAPVAPAAAPAIPKAIPVQSPENSAIAGFRKAHGTAYDPKSQMDRRKLQQMLGKSAAWANLEKRAGLPGGALAQKGLTAGKSLFDKARGVLGGTGRVFQPAGTGVPAKKSMKGAGDFALTVGGLGGAGVVGHSIGSSSGRQQGVTEGVDAGLQRGVQAATSAQPGDPGVLGRLMDVFRGQQQGPDAPSILSNLQGDKDALIKSILAGRPS